MKKSVLSVLRCPFSLFHPSNILTPPQQHINTFLQNIGILGCETSSPHISRRVMTPAVSSLRTNSAARDGGSSEPFISRSSLSVSLTGFFGIDVSEIFYLFLNGREESPNLFLP